MPGANKKKVVLKENPYPIQPAKTSQPKPNTSQKKTVEQKPINSSPVQPVQQTQPKKTQPVEYVQHVQPVKTEPAQPVKPVYNPNSPEMLKYKGNLRGALFAKFPVGSIQGSGTCDVQFSVDNSGKLINRKFLNQSDNKSLNDAVYYMLMSVPKFTPPPENYNGESIRMHFSINNGNYEISIQ